MSKRKNLEQITNDLSRQINHNSPESKLVIVEDEEFSEKKRYQQDNNKDNSDLTNNNSSSNTAFKSSNDTSITPNQKEDWIHKDKHCHSIQNGIDTNNNNLIRITTTTTPATTNISSLNVNLQDSSIYRGLYPINEVKSLFKKTIVDGKKLYTCLWNDCNFKTWKYSQHISRHIYLKHIGIKKLQCKVSGCEKMFKRPESLVQHTKNHSCGFGIDSKTMKDPNNVCGMRNIKRFFTRALDNDIYVFKCIYDNCPFHTHNSGSIRRHVHNQHICPYSSTGNAANNHHQQKQQMNRIIMSPSSSSSSSINQQINGNQSTIIVQDLASYIDDVTTNEDIGVEVQLNELEGKTYDPFEKKIRSIQHQHSSDHLAVNSGEIVDDDDNHSINEQYNILEHLRQSSSKVNESIKLFNSDEDEDDKESVSDLLKENRNLNSNELYTKDLKEQIISSNNNHSFNIHSVNLNTNQQNPLMDRQKHLLTWSQTQYYIEQQQQQQQQQMPLNLKSDQEKKPLLFQQVGNFSFSKNQHETELDQSISTNQIMLQKNSPELFSKIVDDNIIPYKSVPNAMLNNFYNYHWDNNRTRNGNNVEDDTLDPSINNEVRSPMGEKASSTNRKYKGRDKTGLYSLKKFPSQFRRNRMPDGNYQYECTNCDGQYVTKSQASMIRHIWQHIPQDFRCPICEFQCENEFALYKHKKMKHPEMTSQHNRTKSSSTRSKSISKVSNHKKPMLITNKQNTCSNFAFPGGNIDEMVANQSNQCISSTFFPFSMNQLQSQRLPQLQLKENAMTNENEDEPLDDIVKIDNNELKMDNTLSVISRRNLHFKRYKYDKPLTEYSNSDDESGCLTSHLNSKDTNVCSKSDEIEKNESN